MARRKEAAGWSEERLLRWLRSSDEDGRRGAGVRRNALGHDAAVLRRPRGSLVTCVDQTIEGVHYERDTTPARIGTKAAGRVLSDLAATAATPLGLLLALRAPRGVSERWMRAIIGAVRRRADACGIALVGGDLAAAPGPAALTVTGLGELAAGGRAPTRDRARPGQLVLLTGPVGGSRLGRHLRFEPRLVAGRHLHAHGATALMDVSDGLARDLWRLAATAGVAIDVEHVPVHRDARRQAMRSRRSALFHALHDGEDHELIATLAPADARRVLASGVPGCPGPYLIGRVRKGRGLRVPRAEVTDEGEVELRPWNDEGGWVHGG